jgi:CDP-paratose 2-epimerase
MSGPILVTGGAGFIGCNIADRLAREGHDVIVLDALARAGVEVNLKWLKQRHGGQIHPVIADIRDEEAVAKAVRDASAVFHMAAQVAVTTSLVEPIDDYEINIQGTLTVLEAVRRRDAKVPVIFASTNKVYGDLADIELWEDTHHWTPADAEVRAHGISEARPLDFHTPYGCSKGAADQYVLDYARSYGVPTAVLRMSCIYGPRQMGTEDQGWVAHFLIRALEGQSITIYGDGKQVRDVLHVDDAVDTYLAALRSIDRVSGRVFNLGGGPDNAISLRQLLLHIETLTGHPVETRWEEWRAGDQRYFVADARRARETLGLGAPKPWQQGIADLAEWLAKSRGLALHTGHMEAAE